MAGFRHDIAGGNGDLIADSVQSPDFVAGSAGWQIRRDGSVEFNNATIRGSFLQYGEVFYRPSGDTTGATDATNINSYLSSGVAVELLAGGVYYINQPLTMYTNSRLFSPVWDFASNNDGYGAGPGQPGGAMLMMTAGFTGRAALSFPDPGAGVQNYGADIAGITVNGVNVPSGSTPLGVWATGAWGACNLRGVTVFRTPGHCFRLEASSVTGYVCDEWVIDHCKASASRTGQGFSLSYPDDAVISHCNASQNWQDNWGIDGGVNARFTDCKGENSKNGGGFHLTGLGSTATQVYFETCTTHVNAGNGFLFDALVGGAQGRYVLSNCHAVQDSGSGYLSSGCKSAIMMTGCTAHLASGYGAAEESASYGMSLIGCRMGGTLGPTHDDGTNVNALSNLTPVPF